MEPNYLLLEIPNLLDDDFYSSELFVKLREIVNFMAKDPCDYNLTDDKVLKDYRIWTIQRACDPDVSSNTRQVAKNWFYVIEEISDERKKIIDELLQ